MHGDNGIVIDIDAVDSAVHEADLIVVGFEFWPERLLIDLRPDPGNDTPPLIEIVDPLPGVQERNVWLAERRPGVAPPEQFLFFTWPHTIAFLVASPLPQGVAARLQREQGIDVREEVADVLDDLATIEQRESLAAVCGGEGYETLWSRDEE